MNTFTFYDLLDLTFMVHFLNMSINNYPLIMHMAKHPLMFWAMRWTCLFLR